MKQEYEGKHKAAFTGAIHDNNPGGDLQQHLYGMDDEMSWKQVVKFSKVVTDYLAELATRTADNEAASEKLMATDIAGAARDAIKEE